MKKLNIPEEIKDDLEKQPVRKLDGGYCDKTKPDDPHYGELGDYDSNCVWHSEV